jgi:hypothetical protein
MEKFLKRFGFERGSLGNPLTETQMRVNRKAVWYMTGAAFICSFLVWWASDQLMNTQTFGWLGAAVIYFPIFVGVMRIAFDDLYDDTSLAPVPAHVCLRVASWSDTYQDIRAHIVAINRQGRQLAMCDYYLMRPFVEAHQFARYAEKARQACLTLREIDTP